MGIYFRGDNRDPDGSHGRFARGFDRRNAGHEDEPVLHGTEHAGLRPEEGDMNPWAAVCVTKRMEVAPIFPVTNDDDRWVYAFLLDEDFVKDSGRYSQYVDTHAWQRDEGFQWPDYAWEEAVGAIDPPDIIGAVKVRIQRIECTSFGIPGPFQARFQVLGIEMNGWCTVADAIAEPARERLRAWHRDYGSGFSGLTPDPSDTPARPLGV